MREVWREMLAELVEHDALLVLGKGMGAFSVLASFLSLHSHSSSLVLVLNTSKPIQNRLELQLRAQVSRRCSSDVI